ncbi:NUMOD4 domain-containing protein [Mycobacterium colombiense]
MTTEEVWRPIPNYEGCYDISTFGRHRGLDRLVRYCPHGVERTRIVRGGVLSAMRRSREGDRWRIKLYRNGSCQHFDLADLVLATFQGPPPSLNHYAEHVDGDVNNCRLANLRWALRNEQVHQEAA